MDENYGKPWESVDLGPSIPEDNMVKFDPSNGGGFKQQAGTVQMPAVTTPATGENGLPAGVNDYSDQIQQMYDAQQRAREEQLKAAYDENLAAANAAREKITPLYNTQYNDYAAQYERTRRNNNLQADLNGLNTGTASQMSLAGQSNYLGGYGKLAASEAAELSEADRQIANLEISYKNAVAQALADNDYQKATALLAEYQRRDAAATEMQRYNDQQALANAQLRAQYGDFSGYAALYGQEAANQMYQFWLQQNPNYAWANGLIDAKTYKKLTGKNPPKGTTTKTVYKYINKTPTTPETPPDYSKEIGDLDLDNDGIPDNQQGGSK